MSEQRVFLDLRSCSLWAQAQRVKSEGLTYCISCADTVLALILPLAPRREGITQPVASESE